MVGPSRPRGPAGSARRWSQHLEGWGLLPSTAKRFLGRSTRLDSMLKRTGVNTQRKACWRGCHNRPVRSIPAGVFFRTGGRDVMVRLPPARRPLLIEGVMQRRQGALIMPEWQGTPGERPHHGPVCLPLGARRRHAGSAAPGAVVPAVLSSTIATPGIFEARNPL